MQHHCDQLLSILSHDRTKYALSDIVGRESFAVVVVVRVVLLAVVCERIDGHVGVNVARLSVDYLNIAVLK